MKTNTWYKLIALQQALKEAAAAVRAGNQTQFAEELQIDLDGLDSLPLKLSNLLLLEHKCPCAAGCMESFCSAIECEFTNADRESKGGKIFKDTTEELIRQAKEA